MGWKMYIGADAELDTSSFALSLSKGSSFFCLISLEQGQGFDRLSPNGIDDERIG